MNSQIIAVFLQEGGRFISELIRSRSRQRPISIELPLSVEEESPATAGETTPSSQKTGPLTEDKIKKGTSCIPCTNSHLHACVGLLNEAARFAKTDGLSADALKRIDTCLGEIVAAERIDLNPENTISLAPGEKAIADYVSIGIRNIRHDLEGLTSPAQVEPIAARTAELQHNVAQRWFQYRLSQMSTEDKAKLGKRVIEQLQEHPSAD